MKLLPWLYALALHAILSPALAKRAFLRKAASQEASMREAMALGESRAAVHMAISSMMDKMLSRRSGGPGLKDIVHMVDKKMDFNAAVQQLGSRVPADVASLMSITTVNSNNYDEASLQKARKILNDMMFKGYQELDDLMFEAIDFEEKNRGTFRQVQADLARLGASLARDGEERVAAGQGIIEMDQARKQAQDTLEGAKLEYEKERQRYYWQLSVRKSDLAVFDFVLQMTACSGGSFLQKAGRKAPSVRFCNTKDGLVMRFNNASLQQQAERLMTPDAKLALRKAMGQMPLSLLQEESESEDTEEDDAEDIGDSQDDAQQERDRAYLQEGQQNSQEDQDPETTTTTAITTTTILTTVQPKPPITPVREEVDHSAQWKRCVDTATGCGQLHDLMSLEWGKFRDSFDLLATEMKRNQEDFDSLKANINDQLSVISEQKGRHMEALASSVSNINANTEEMNEKDEERLALSKEYERSMASFKHRMTEIMYTKICSLRTIRDGLMSHSSTSPPSKITDCNFGDWETESGECMGRFGNLITCDDACPGKSPFDCGGQEWMQREVIINANEFGMACPALRRSKKCGQQKCPVNCILSQWSGWSKCSKECEGGVQVRTRSIIRKPNHGGEICDAGQEDRPCNTGSCDVNCGLDAWSDWSPCSMACSGGVKDSVRKVIAPIQGNGICPSKTSRERLIQAACNTQKCVGDEICIAQQDLILAIDGSGSLGESGFTNVKKFAKELVGRYKSEYFTTSAVKMGLLEFGNGKLNAQADGTHTIEPAMNVQPLTDDLSKVTTAIDGMKWVKGFTNMAQAFALADDMLREGRSSAQSAVLVLTDGKVSFQVQTEQEAEVLRDKNVKIYMAPITDFDGRELRPLQKWSSSYLRIPGMKALENNADLFVTQLIVHFCPDSMSPALLKQKENEKKFALMKEQGWPDSKCGKQWHLQWQRVTSPDECAAIAREKKLLAFAYGNGEAAGTCYVVEVTVSQGDYDTIKSNKVKSTCPGGGWFFNPFFDTYAVDPSSLPA